MSFKIHVKVDKNVNFKNLSNEVVQNSSHSSDMGKIDY